MTEQQKQKTQDKEQIKKIMAMKKLSLMAKRAAYRRTQMDEFRDGMVSLVMTPDKPKEGENEKMLVDVEGAENVPTPKRSKNGAMKTVCKKSAFKVVKKRRGSR